MRPLAPVRKRRRTFIRAFQSINLQRGRDSEDDNNGEDGDADSSQAVANEHHHRDDGTASTTSSLEDDEADIDGDPMGLLSDREEAKLKANRKVMLELVFGSETNSPVDSKLQKLIRTSLRQSLSSSGDVAVGVSVESADDMNIDPSYSRPSDPIPLQPALHRSNSLPDLFPPTDRLDNSMETESTDGSATE
jgi:hypothetical protein